ncbi:hypothetical protein C0992_003584 [Termitomyces sp. T32_za158]|nr:hypothetical protein C0992_003584 [Termitomyces sp. T32_za158]
MDMDGQDISPPQTWNGLVIHPLSLEPNLSDTKIVAATSDEQGAIYEAIDVETEMDPILIPFRRWLAPPPVDLSSIDLDPQLDWVQNSRALTSPESPVAAAVVYDNFPTVTHSSSSNSDEIVRYIPFPWPNSGRLRSEVNETDETEDDGEQMYNEADEAGDQPHWVQSDENQEAEDQSEWEQMEGLEFNPPPEPDCLISGYAIPQTDSSFHHMHRQLRDDKSCFRPLKKLATVMGWAVHNYIGHRIRYE